MIPKKHSKLRFYGEVQVPEGKLNAPVKRKPRYYPIVILLGATVPIKDDIIGISVDLVDEGIEVQLKRFPAPWSLRNDLCIVMTPP